MNKKGKYWVLKKEYKRFKADKNRKYKKDTIAEYLHYIKIN